LGAADLEPCDVAVIGGPGAGARCASILSAHSYQSGVSRQRSFVLRDSSIE
jgi:hypothetical protein